ncbi:unnamed protein product [Brachionus calyciflorus]|uniref:Uncharacterized protein n=1 Tax=Brachionus calyciflorus TaxID=104777 RepID=A0A814M0N8_9BILA|nr:unnamed protein product [Brachionus calyciflorus]
MFSYKEIKEIIFCEIYDLASEISTTSCEDCTYNYGTQYGHSFLNPFFYNLALKKAFERVKTKYNLDYDFDSFYEENQMKEKNGTSYDRNEI